MTKPITPQQAKEKNNIPEEVIQAFNNMIERTFSNGSATFTQDAVIIEIFKTTPNVSRQKIFKNGWLDIETIFKKCGWNVEYDKPGYCEAYDARFTFTAKNKK